MGLYLQRQKNISSAKDLKIKNMTLLLLRLRRHPHLFVGKKSSSYAIQSDEAIRRTLNYAIVKTIDEALQIDAFWFTGEKFAKVWTNAASLKRLLSYCSKEDKESTFSEYDIILNGNIISYNTLKTL